MQKAAQRAGRAAPAVAALGALAVAPQSHIFAAASATTATTASTTATLAAVADQAAAALAQSGEVRTAPTGLPASVRKRRYQAQYPPKIARKHHRVHHSGGTSARSGGSSQQGSTTAAAGPGTLTCSGSASGMLPANYAEIVSFLTANGYTGIAAAGIAGNIYQESMGNPESVGSGGGGLIGWTPLPGGFVTGNPAADLQAQLAAILTFNQQWAQYIPALNAATTPAEAADIYVTDFERAGIPAAANREAAAEAVAAACGL